MADKNWTDPAAYEAIKSTDSQELRLQAIRAAARIFAETLEKALPSGPDKAHTYRQFRTAVMWAHYAISRNVETAKEDDQREDDQNGGEKTP
jgi:hypothetical protein